MPSGIARARRGSGGEGSRLPAVDLRPVNPVRAAIRSGTLTRARRLILSGNDAIAKAALETGARFFAGYPITPSSEVLEYVARYIFRVDGTYLQMEDEIGSIAAAIGASLGGVKSFTATSGPGFSLKQENLGFGRLWETGSPSRVLSLTLVSATAGPPIVC